MHNHFLTKIIDKKIKDTIQRHMINKQTCFKHAVLIVVFLFLQELKSSLHITSDQINFRLSDIDDLT